MSAMRYSISTWSALFVLSTAALPRTLVVNQKSVRASDRNPGTEARPLKTISAAEKLAQPGDTVLVRAGVYRDGDGIYSHDASGFTLASGRLRL